MLQNFPILYYLLGSTLLYWLMLLFASLAHSRGYTVAGFLLALGNRDNMPERNALMARADRAAKNMGENLLIFAIVALASISVGGQRDLALTGAQIFLVARLLYWPIYLFGVKYVRTVIWGVALVGVGLVVVSMV
jgi:uncharacterized MAPEG superfamily protein